MEIVRNLPGAGYSYILGQHGIEYEGQFLGRYGARLVKMSGLAQSVYSGVGASCALNDYSFACQGFEDVLQFSLYAGRVFLKLPAAVTGAVV